MTIICTFLFFVVQHVTSVLVVLNSSFFLQTYLFLLYKKNPAKVKFCGIFRDKIAEKSVNFAGIFGANLGWKAISKKRRILWLFLGQISLEIDRVCTEKTSVFNVFLTEVIIMLQK